jgi:hypothetical protein
MDVQAAPRRLGGRVKRSSFLKKRSKKLLTVGAWLPGSVRKGIKVFWFFFSKKNSLSYFPATTPRA